MNPIILSPAMGIYWGRLISSALVRQPVWEKENSASKPVKLRLKTDRVSHPSRVKGLGNYIIENIYVCANKNKSLSNSNSNLTMGK